MNNIIIDSNSPFRIRRDIQISIELLEELNIPNTPYVINISEITDDVHDKIKEYYNCEIPFYKMKTNYYCSITNNNLTNIISFKKLSLKGIYHHISHNGFHKLQLLNEKDRNFIIKTCNFYDLTLNINNRNILDNSIYVINNMQNIFIDNKNYNKIAFIVHYRYIQMLENFNLFINNSTISELTIIFLNKELIKKNVVVKNINGNGLVNRIENQNNKFIDSNKYDGYENYNFNLPCDEIITNYNISIAQFPLRKLTVFDSTIYISNIEQTDNIVNCDVEYRGNLKSINMNMINENINSLNISTFNNKISIITSIDITKMQRIANVNVNIHKSEIKEVICNERIITTNNDLLNELEKNVNLRNKNISFKYSSLIDIKLTNQNIPNDNIIVIDENFIESNLNIKSKIIDKLIIKKNISSIVIDSSTITDIIIENENDRFNEITIKNSCINRIECNKILNISKINCITSNIKESNLNVYNNVNELIINNKHVGVNMVNKLLSLDNIISIIKNDSLTKLNLSCINIYTDYILDLTNIKNVHLESVFGNKILMHDYCAVNCIFQQ